MNHPDSNSKAICAALRAAGAHVSQIASASGHGGVPDLLVSFQGAWYVLELKAPKGRISPAQAKFQLDARATVHVVRSVDEALAAIGVRVAA